MAEIHIVATFEYAADDKKRALELMEELVVKTLKEEGCVRFELIEDKTRDHFYFLNETWESKDLHLKHMKSDHFKTITTEMKTLLKEQIVFEGEKIF